MVLAFGFVIAIPGIIQYAINKRVVIRMAESITWEGLSRGC